MLFIKLQQAIYQRLTEAGLTVYDSSQPVKKMPAVVIFSPTMSFLNDKTSYYKRVDVKLMVISEESHGKRPLYESVGDLVEAMRGPFVLPDASVDLQKLVKIGDTVSQDNGLQSTTINYQFNITTKEVM